MRKCCLAALALACASRLSLAELKVMDAEDTVRLVSGEEIRCTVLAAGLKAVVIVVEAEDEAGEKTAEEKSIPREQVESIARGEVSPTIKAYTTELVGGQRTVTGIGTDEAGAGEDGAEGEGAEGPAARPARPAKKPAKDPRGRPGGGKRGGAPDMTDEQIDGLIKNNPGLGQIIKSMGGRDNARQWLERNRSGADMRKYLEQLMKDGKLPLLK